MALTAEAIEGFTKSVLGARYDDPKPIPDHHRYMWKLCVSPHPQVAIAAPRGSAKSTAITFAYILASALFKEHQHILIISANEELASGFLNDIKVELQENELITELFGFKRFIKERETEIIVELEGNYRFRIIVKGAEQRMRGLKWERKRPSLVVPDDLEDEELVASELRREKFRRWFYGAVKPILRDGGKIRYVGTIMHMDSLLNRFMPPMKSGYTVDTDLIRYTESDPEKLKDMVSNYDGDTSKRAWLSVLFRAHNTDFTQFLWPEMYSEERLRAIRQDFAEQGMLDIYSQEYLNNPLDPSKAYFRKSDFLPMLQGDHEIRKTYYAAADLAITQHKRSAYSAMPVGGMDSDRRLYITDMRRGRLDSLEISDEIFSIHARWDIAVFRMESENIQKSIGPFLYERMNKTGAYLNIDAKPPTKDKESRAQTLRAMMRAGQVRFDKEAEWYPDLEEELLHFPKWSTCDQVDALAWLALLVHEMIEAPTVREYEEELWDSEHDDFDYGFNAVTGY
jgi:predicted phage terminase large subunit-like protein